MINVLFSSGMYTSPRWSRQALSPSNTDWVAKFNSSSRIHLPVLRAERKGPSCQANLAMSSPPWTSSPALSPLPTGKSDPKRSLISVWSERLIRMSWFPVNAANAVTRDDFPTPGVHQVWSLTHYYTFGFSQSGIPIKVCINSF